ncbi:MAG: InlB B-repeat-containing protein [Treponema sp.]|nr:InlB B-repeat-containing protein [Treponema sp.]
MKKIIVILGTIAFIAASAAFTACNNDPEQRDYFIVTFNKNNSDAGSTEAVPRTIHINGVPDFRVGPLPAPPSRPGYLFCGWNTESDADEENFFEDTLIKGDITVYALWQPRQVSVIKDGIETLFLDLETALDSITGAGDYTVKIYSSQTLMPSGISGEGINITLEAGGGAVTVSCSGGDLFTVNNGASLTLSAGLTLSGDSKAGRGVYVPGGTFVMEGGEISGFAGFNSAGVYIGNGGAFTMEDGTISGNASNGEGGGVYVDSSGTFNLKNGAISGNKAVNGGGVFNRGSFTMDGGTVSGNETNAASGYGAGVYSLGKFTLNVGTISGNINAANGGGVYISASNAAVPDSGTFIMKGGAISGNSAASGGGVFNMGSFEMDGENGAISGNTASTSGGGVYVAGGSSFALKKGTVGGSAGEKNIAASGGGVYVSQSGVFSMTDGAVNGNEASGSGEMNGGGGVYNLSLYFTLKGGTINGNTAVRGGGIYSRQKFAMEGGTVSGNTATGTGVADSGGGIFVSALFTITGGTVSGNTAARGGGVYARFFNMEGGTISGNTATGTGALDGGGGVYDADGSFEKYGGGSITGNIASSGMGNAAFVIWTDDDPSTEDVPLIRNSDVGSADDLDSYDMSVGWE